MEMEKWDDLILAVPFPREVSLTAERSLFYAFIEVWEHGAWELTLINVPEKSKSWQGWEAALGAPSPTDYGWIN